MATQHTLTDDTSRHGGNTACIDVWPKSTPDNTRWHARLQIIKSIASSGIQQRLRYHSHEQHGQRGSHMLLYFAVCTMTWNLDMMIIRVGFSNAGWDINAHMSSIINLKEPCCSTLYWPETWIRQSDWLPTNVVVVPPMIGVQQTSTVPIPGTCGYWVYCGSQY